jgi:CheY-like chemotaxis protein
MEVCLLVEGEAVNGDATRPILIVEDDLDIRDALQEILEDEGYQACAAGNGAEALELLDRVPKPGLVLLDLMMPVMDGYQFLEIFRAKPQFADIPVVVVTAGILVVPGIAGFIKKPFDTEQLLRTVNKLFPVPGLTNGRDARFAPG